MPRKISLPRGWNRRVKSSILHILALSHYGFLDWVPNLHAKRVFWRPRERTVGPMARVSNIAGPVHLSRHSDLGPHCSFNALSALGLPTASLPNAPSRPDDQLRTCNLLA